MLKQEMGWFDLPVNGTGALCSRLSADASAIQGVSSSNFLSGLWFIGRLVIFYRPWEVVAAPFVSQFSQLS